MQHAAHVAYRNLLVQSSSRILLSETYLSDILSTSHATHAASHASHTTAHAAHSSI